LLNRPTQKPKALRARISSASVVLLSGSGLATAINFAYNIAVARFLGPNGFGHATAVYTLLTLISAITLSFQIIAAKIVAQQKTLEGKTAAYRGFHAGAWVCANFFAFLLLIFQRQITDYLNLPSAVLIVYLAIGVLFYIPLGSRRGYLQGTYGFRSLATSLVLEGAVRLGGSLLMIFLGFGVKGVIAANSAAVAVAYFAITPKRTVRVLNPLRFGHAFRETIQAVVFFSGQVLINNCDIVLVKHFFLPTAAGLYAAVAMVGRVIYSFSQAVVNSMFPLVAGSREEERKDLTVIAHSLSLVFGIGSLLAIALRLTPPWVWAMFLGAKFETSGPYSLSYLLALYAITTVVYSLSAVIITYEMSYKIANTSWIQLAFSGVVIAGICLFHSSLREVILVQLVLMAVLLVCVAMPFLAASLLHSGKPVSSGVFRPLRLLRVVPENEVIAEFLKSDLNRDRARGFSYSTMNPVLRGYQDALRGIVLNPDLEDPAQNAKRRALFFIRHSALWNELPEGTEWYEIEVNDTDLDQIRVFPRAQWRKIARGDFSIVQVADCIRKGENTIDSRFLTKISEIQEHFVEEENGLGSVILIGISESEPLTIIDGNHRLVSAMLGPPGKVQSLRFLCGLSPQMMECCWYNTNLSTLFRYGRNVMRHVVRRPMNELARVLQSQG
jgi:O-antigen/teichoic acid export membrane protein